MIVVVRERRRPVPPAPAEDDSEESRELETIEVENLQEFMRSAFEAFENCPVELPQDIAERLRYLANFRSPGSGSTWTPDIDRYVCRTVRQAKLAGFTHFQIAQNLRMHVRAIPKLMKRAQEQAKEQFLHIEPSTDYIEAIERYEIIQQQAIRWVATRGGNLTTLDLTRLQQINDRCEKGKLLVKDSYGYFDTINYGKLTDRGGGGGSREGLRRLREALSRMDDPDDLDED